MEATNRLWIQCVLLLGVGSMPSPVYDGDTLNATSRQLQRAQQPMVINYAFKSSTTYLVVVGVDAASLSDNRSFAVANIPAGTYVLTFNIYFGSIIPQRHNTTSPC